MPPQVRALGCGRSRMLQHQPEVGCRFEVGKYRSGKLAFMGSGPNSARTPCNNRAAVEGSQSRLFDIDVPEADEPDRARRGPQSPHLSVKRWRAARRQAFVWETVRPETAGSRNRVIARWFLIAISAERWFAP